MNTFGRARDRGWITARFTHRLHLLLGRRDPHVRRPRRSDVASPSGAIGAQLSLRPRRVPQAGVAGHHARRARIGTSADPSRRSESIQARVSRRSAPRVLGYARLGRVDAALGAQLNGARRASNFVWRPARLQRALFEPVAGTPHSERAPRVERSRPHLVLIFLQRGAAIMRDARGMCRVPSAAQRRASGFWCRAVESSTAFSHDDRSPPVPSQITSRCIRRLGSTP